MVYNAITRHASVEQRRKRFVEPIAGADAALRIRDGDERRVDAVEQHGERERLALRTKNAARAAAPEDECRRIVDIGQDTGTPVVEDYVDRMPFKFTGRLGKLLINVDPQKLTETQQRDLLEAQAEMAEATE